MNGCWLEDHPELLISYPMEFERGSEVCVSSLTKNSNKHSNSACFDGTQKVS